MSGFKLACTRSVACPPLLLFDLLSPQPWTELNIPEHKHETGEQTAASQCMPCPVVHAWCWQYNTQSGCGGGLHAMAETSVSFADLSSARHSWNKAMGGRGGSSQPLRLSSLSSSLACVLYCILKGEE
mmetsp:Transcript_112796/g.195811  ORF Transcript_112796/g.195811 Transcript_112796/m.195811 type:complete len:128 (-) Transcript_112796:692-1075(-)